MKRFVLSIIVIVGATISFAQTADEKVGAMMNGGKWFELREFLQTTTDSINPFLDSYAKAMVAHFFNQPEVAVDHFSALLNNPQVDLGNVATAGLLMCSDISKVGDNEAAAKTLEAINASIQPYYEYLDSSIVTAINIDIAKYKALAHYKINDLQPFGLSAGVPFNLASVGADTTLQEVISVEGAINNHNCRMTFDTGAGVNVISEALAEELGLDILDINLTAGGIGVQSARLGVAKELTMGDITIRNVPFYVMTILSGNDEADKYLEFFQIIIGKPIMGTLKYFTIDFTDKALIVRTESDLPAETPPNLCISNVGIYKLRCTTFGGVSMLLNPDTGTPGYGFLNSNMTPVIKESRTLQLAPKAMRLAGAGGVAESEYYDVENLPISICGVSATIPRMPLLAAPKEYSAEYDGRIGLATFMLFHAVSFDIPRMIMQPIPIHSYDAN